MLKKGILSLIKIYQKTVSPDHGVFSFWLKNGSTPLTTSKVCRFYPTCSEYAYEAVEKYGVKKGLILTFKRLSSCHPLSSGGYDPVK
jgi:uncharacterized protein